MKSIRRCDRLFSVAGLLLICAIVFSILGSNQFLVTVIAAHREFEVEKYDENITILPNALQTIDFDLQEGEEFEIIFTLQVKEALPVDAWFVNEDHYTLLRNGAQFLYFLDGSEQEVTYVKKIVTLTEHDLYKLVITNYHNNQTVEVNAIYEIRTFYTDTDSISPLVLTLSFLVIILAILLLILYTKVRGYKQKLDKVSKFTLSKKQKPRKSKKHEPKEKKKASSKKPETHKSSETEPEITEKTPPAFCGYCGTPVTTPFCTSCGRKIQNI